MCLKLALDDVYKVLMAHGRGPVLSAEHDHSRCEQHSTHGFYICDLGIRCRLRVARRLAGRPVDQL
jgi:hypothetical protein